MFRAAHAENKLLLKMPTIDILAPLPINEEPSQAYRLSKFAQAWYRQGQQYFSWPNNRQRAALPKANVLPMQQAKSELPCRGFQRLFVSQELRVEIALGKNASFYKVLLHILPPHRFGALCFN